MTILRFYGLSLIAFILFRPAQGHTVWHYNISFLGEIIVSPFAILELVFLQFGWLLLLPILAAFLQTPFMKGWLGEALLHLSLIMHLDSKRYRLLRNVTLPTEDGSTQIDHVVVSRHGIFVVETKNYGGWIFGKPHDKTWTQKFPRHSSRFQNPLRQNYKHVRTLEQLTGVPAGALFSVIAFVGSAEFKTAMPDNVTRLHGCAAFIRAKTALLLSEQEVARVIRRIAAGRLEPSMATHAAHARHVRDLVRAREAQASAEAAPVPTPAPAPAPTPAAQPAKPSCPHCGSAVDDYQYKTGAKAGSAFRGCVTFPDCRYRVDLPDAVRA